MNRGERRTGRSREELQKRQVRLHREWHVRQHNRRVLLVSGLPDEQSMYTMLLEDSGFQITVESSPDVAFEEARRCEPAVVVVDYAVDGDGLGLVRRLRSDHRTEGASIVMLSSHVRAQDRTAAERAGVDLFLTKPCLPETMTEQIMRLLEADI